MNTKMITVFTPSYNRAYSLPDLYESLLKQSDFSFEWLIVDDGSTDNTEELIRSFQKTDNPFDIRYYKKENGGKHTAINMGVQLARGLLFFIVDSDDQLHPEAIEKLHAWENSIEKKQEFAGVSGNKGDMTGTLLGSTFSEYSVDATNLEREKFNILGDKAEAYYTNVLRDYPFPVIDGERFMDECVAWDRIGAAGLKIRWVNEVIYLVEQRADGLIAQGNKRFANSPKGYALAVKQKMDIFNYSWLERQYAGFYFYETVKERVSIHEAAKLLDRSILGFVGFWLYQSAKIWVKSKIMTT